MNTTSPAQRDENYLLLDSPQPIFELIYRAAQEIGCIPGLLDFGVFGYDVERNLAVVQIQREYKAEGGQTKYRKICVLIGIDNGKVFVDRINVRPDSIPFIDKMTPEDVVNWAHSIIFDFPHATKFVEIIRQGNLALIPMMSIPFEVVRDAHFDAVAEEDHFIKSMTMGEDHEVIVDGDLYEDRKGCLYVDGTIKVVHTKGQYDTVRTKGLYKVAMVRRPKSLDWIREALTD
jgi:hypothetical protein